MMIQMSSARLCQKPYSEGGKVVSWDCGLEQMREAASDATVAISWPTPTNQINQWSRARLTITITIDARKSCGGQLTITIIRMQVTRTHYLICVTLLTLVYLSVYFCWHKIQQVVLTELEQWRFEMEQSVLFGLFSFHLKLNANLVIQCISCM